MTDDQLHDGDAEPSTMRSCLVVLGEMSLEIVVPLLLLAVAYRRYVK